MEYIENVQGKNIIITNSNGDNANSVRLLGDIEQNNYTGKNLFDYVSHLRASFNGLTSVINSDGSITTSGKPTANYVQVSEMYAIEDILEDNTNYVISQENYSAGSNLRLVVGIVDKTSSTVLSYLTADSTYKTFKVDKSRYKYNIWLQTDTTAKWGDSSRTFRNKYQLEKAATPTSFEPYVGKIAAPNPDYPQEVKIVKGMKNLLKNTTTDSGDFNYWYSYSTFDESTGEITRKTSTTSEGFIAHRIRNLKAGKTYTFSCLAKSNGYVSSMDFYCYNANVQGVISRTGMGVSTEYRRYVWTFTTKKDIDYYDSVIRVDNNGSTVSGTESILTIKDVMLEEGETTYGYAPYGQKLLKINNCEKNLLNLNSVSPSKLTGLNSSITDNKLYLDGTNSAAGYIVANTTYTNTFLSPGTYKFSVSLLSGNITTNNKSCVFCIKDYSDTVNALASVRINDILSHGGTWGVTITLTKTTNIAFESYINGSMTFDDVNLGIQIESGNTITAFEPYQGKEYLINMNDIELCKIGDYQDKFIKGTGKNLLNYIPKDTIVKNGITVTCNNDGSITYNGTCTTGFGLTFDLKEPLTLQPGSYTSSISAPTQSTLYCSLDNISATTINTSSNSTKTFTINQETTYNGYFIWINGGSVVNNYTMYPMIEKGVSNTSYEPYGAKDKWLLHKEIGKVVLDGSEYWIQVGTRFWISLDGYNNGTYKAISDCFKQADSWAEHTSTNYSIIIYKDNAWESARLSINDSDFTGREFPNWLSTNNVTVYYQLANPTNILITDTNLIKQLDELYNMKLPYGNVQIDSIGDIPAFIDMSYNNWNKDINPSDRAALLDGTATIETEIQVQSNNLFDVGSDVISNMGLSTTLNHDKLHIFGKNVDRGYVLPSPSNWLQLGHFEKGTYIFKSTGKYYRNVVFSLRSVDPGTAVTGDIELNKERTFTLNEDLDLRLNIWVDVTTYTFDDEYTISIVKKEEDALTQNNSVISWNHEDFRYVKDEGFIGQFVARQLTGELKDLDDDFNITDKELHLKLGVRTNNNTNWYSLGNFLTTKVTNDEVKDKTSFESLDYTKKFNKKYEDTITYPCTARDLALNVCEQCGVELATPIFKNYDYVIEGNVFKNNETCRDVMKAIGKLAFSWIRVDWDNKVYLDFTKEIVQRDYDDADNSQYYNLTTQKEKFGPVNRIVIGYSQIDGERTFISDDESISENGECELTVYDNPLVYNSDQRAMIIESARDLMGLEYMPLNTLTIGHPWLKGKELFNIIDMEGNTHKTIPFDRTIQYFGHIKTLIDVATATKTENSLAYKPDFEKGLMETEIQVNKNTGDITSLTRRTENVEDGLGNTYTIEQTNQLIQNASTGITNTFSEAGGNNIFRNTGLWFEQSDSVVKTGKNLFDKDNANILNNVALTPNGFVNENDDYCAYIECKPNTTYTISKVISKRLRVATTQNVPTTTAPMIDYSANDNESSITITTSQNAKYLSVFYRRFDDTLTSEQILDTIQIELGSTATTYEPYYEYTNDYEFWEGPVIKQKEESAANLNALLLQIGTLSQEQIVPNGNYTISFKYKKLIPLANVKCIINDVEYALTSMENVEFIQTIEVSSQHINVKFVSDINDACEIYDLMVNAGSVKLAYSQNQNETTTDTVNISKGITITSTDTDTTFKANADGIRTLDKNGNVLTKFTDTGMTTKESIIEDEAQIVGVLVQSVSNQTWFTRL